MKIVCPRNMLLRNRVADDFYKISDPHCVSECPIQTTLSWPLKNMIFYLGLVEVPHLLYNS